MLSSDFLKSLVSFIPLFGLHVRAFVFRLIEFLRVAVNYWFTFSFFMADIWLSLIYMGKSPYHLVKSDNWDEGEPYGETPLTTLDQIARECHLLSKDVVFDLGCGRGRTVFWLAQFVKCTAIGVEKVSIFVNRANRIKKHLKLEKALFWQGDIKEMDLTSATAVYLYGTGFGDEKLKELVERLNTLKQGTKVITVSFPLDEVEGGSGFLLKKSFLARYPWGKTRVYLQEKR